MSDRKHFAARPLQVVRNCHQHRCAVQRLLELVRLRRDRWDLRSEVESGHLHNSHDTGFQCRKDDRFLRDCLHPNRATHRDRE